MIGMAQDATTLHQHRRQGRGRDEPRTIHPALWFSLGSPCLSCSRVEELHVMSILAAVSAIY